MASVATSVQTATASWADKAVMKGMLPASSFMLQHRGGYCQRECQMVSVSQRVWLGVWGRGGGCGAQAANLMCCKW